MTRAFVFDDRTHVVRTGRTVAEAQTPRGGGVADGPHARDAIAALFYVRTLPLKDWRTRQVSGQRGGPQSRR